MNVLILFADFNLDEGYSIFWALDKRFILSRNTFAKLTFKLQCGPLHFYGHLGWMEFFSPVCWGSSFEKFHYINTDTFN